MTHSRRAGFTLIELSIVLVIIGLIASGVFMGASLIRNSQMRAALSEVDRYIKAIDVFQQKYLALPGDMTNAATFWSGATNGNGNGKIGIDDTADQAEWFGAWHQLANAGLVEGRYTGSAGSGGAAHAVPGSNVPSSGLPGGGHTLMYWSIVAGDSDHYATDPGHVLALGGGTSASYTSAPIMTGSEALELDKKIDDGRPAYGTVKSYKPATLNSGCTSSSTASSAIYVTTATDRICGVMIQTGF